MPNGINSASSSRFERMCSWNSDEGHWFSWPRPIHIGQSLWDTFELSVHTIDGAQSCPSSLAKASGNESHGALNPSSAIGRLFGTRTRTVLMNFHLSSPCSELFPVGPYALSPCAVQDWEPRPSVRRVAGWRTWSSASSNPSKSGSIQPIDPRGIARLSMSRPLPNEKTRP